MDLNGSRVLPLDEFERNAETKELSEVSGVTVTSTTSL